MPKDKGACKVCGYKPAHADGLCITDYQFRRRNGRVRTTAELIRHGQRVLMREMERRAS